MTLYPKLSFGRSGNGALSRNGEKFSWSGDGCRQSPYWWNVCQFLSDIWEAHRPVYEIYVEGCENSYSYLCISWCSGNYLLQKAVRRARPGTGKDASLVKNVIAVSSGNGG